MSAPTQLFSRRTMMTAVAQLPTATNKDFDFSVWEIGPAAVVVKLVGPIVAGALVNNVFRLAARPV